MKNIKSLKLFIPLSILSLSIVLIIAYKPIKTNHIYSKEIEFSNSNLIDNSYRKLDDSKFIKKAEEYLYNLFGDNFERELYTPSVIYNGYNGMYSDNITSVHFVESNNMDKGYSLAFDLSSGNMVNLSKIDNTIHPQDSSFLSISDLENISKDYIVKLTNYTEDDFKDNKTVTNSYFNSDDLSFGVEFSFDYDFIHIHLDAVNGELINYQHITLPSYDKFFIMKD